MRPANANSSPPSPRPDVSRGRGRFPGQELKAKDGVFDDALVLIGVPGTGFAGLIAAQFVVEQLVLKEAGYVRSPAIPLGVVVRKGVPGPPMTVRGGPHLCGPASACRHIAVLSAEVPLDPAKGADLARFLVRSISQAGARAVVLLDALPTKGENKGQPPVVGVAVGPEASAFLEVAGATPLESGSLTQFTGAALAEGLDGGANVLALLTPAKQEEPDWAAAARLLGAVAQLANIRIDTTALEGHSRRIDEEVRRRREPVGGPMYA